MYRKRLKSLASPENGAICGAGKLIALRNALHNSDVVEDWGVSWEVGYCKPTARAGEDTGTAICDGIPLIPI